MAEYYKNTVLSDSCNRCVIVILREAFKKINSQSLEDTPVGYISQKYTLDKYTLKDTLWKNNTITDRGVASPTLLQTIVMISS